MVLEKKWRPGNGALRMIMRALFAWLITLMIPMIGNGLLEGSFKETAQIVWAIWFIMLAFVTAVRVLVWIFEGEWSL